MTRKHYVAMAKILREYKNDKRDFNFLLEEIMREFKNNNSRFDRDRFLNAVLN